MNHSYMNITPKKYIIYYYIYYYYYCPFFDSVGFPLHNIPSAEVLMKSFAAEFLRQDACPGINHKHNISIHTYLSLNALCCTWICFTYYIKYAISIANNQLRKSNYVAVHVLYVVLVDYGFVVCA